MHFYTCSHIYINALMFIRICIFIYANMYLYMSLSLCLKNLYCCRYVFFGQRFAQTFSMYMSIYAPVDLPYFSHQVACTFIKASPVRAMRLCSICGHLSTAIACDKSLQIVIILFRLISLISMEPTRSATTEECCQGYLIYTFFFLPLAAEVCLL